MGHMATTPRTTSEPSGYRNEDARELRREQVAKLGEVLARIDEQLALHPELASDDTDAAAR